ncbi:TonB-dependent receptor [Sphingomonas sp.]|uniref:TonB-dependent receptor n=1 Tax=Sphingomonas sp. TaxID=28214 RepID=UPI001850A347|nr:TonB-dependent receptor [Sphingomonas sp.]MBA4763184.1 TonB-dependent receptor [Sphingomonas sp.]
MLNKYRLSCSIAPLLLAVQAQAQAAPETPAPVPAQVETGAAQDDIVVTARRREESAQNVPVSVTAFSGDLLAERSVTTMDQLTYSTPGLTYGRAGNSSNPQIIIRGQSRANLGDAPQPVLTYFADVPMQTDGSIAPTFDLASVQVLKGPQGTLFGRNSTSGAVLINPAAPTDRLEGYLDLGVGNYAMRQVEGAINIPIIDDRIALRLAGQYVKRDGYTRNISPRNRSGAALDNRNDTAYRISLRLSPFDGLTNTTIYDWFEWDRHGDGAVINHVYPNADYPNGHPLRTVVGGPGVSASNPARAPFYDCNTSVTCDIDLSFAAQQTRGPRVIDTGDTLTSQYINVAGLTNTTTWELGAITLKNIFGFRNVNITNLNNPDGSNLPLTTTYNRTDQRQVSDEFQVQGSFAGGALETIAGAFYLKNEPDGPQGFALAGFSPPLRPNVVQSARSLTSKALFASATYEVTSGLKLNLGARHTWDKVEACATSFAAPYPLLDANVQLITLDQCNTQTPVPVVVYRAAATVNGSGPFDVYSVPRVAETVMATGIRSSAQSAAWTWNLGIDYRASDELFFYATVRRGYRAGGVNTPLLGGRLAPFQSYAPETVTDVELGVKSDWRINGMRGRFNLSAFRGIYNNSQRGIGGLGSNFDADGNAATDPSAGTIIVNAGTARAQGFDVEASITPVPPLRLSVFGSYTDLRYTKIAIPTVLVAANAFPQTTADSAFPYAPEYTVGGNMRFEQPLGEFISMVLNADVYHASRIYYSPFKSDRTLSEDPYTLVNLRLDFENLGGTGVALGLFMRNVFDTTFIVSGATTTRTSGYNTVFYNEPRMYGAQLKFRFGR